MNRLVLECRPLRPRVMTTRVRSVGMPIEPTRMVFADSMLVPRKYKRPRSPSILFAATHSPSSAGTFVLGNVPAIFANSIAMSPSLRLSAKVENSIRYFTFE